MQLRPSTLLALAMAVAGSAAALQPDNSAAHQRIGAPAALPIDAQCADTIQLAPVVQMTKAGSTLLGPSLSTVMVYSNGLVTMSSINPIGGGSSAQMVHADPRDVQDLLVDLAEIDAGTICDANITVFDVPLTTVSISRGSADSLTHTYSYWLPEGRQVDVESAIMDFVMGSALKR